MGELASINGNADQGVSGALQGVRALSDALDRMYGVMKGDMAMNATDLSALRMLIIREQRGVAVSPHDVARHLRISTASTTKLLDRLSASGHLERRPHPSDGRARIVVISDGARRVFFEHFGARLAAMRDVAAEYTPEELSTIVRFLAEMTEAIDPS